MAQTAAGGGGGEEEAGEKTAAFTGGPVGLGMHSSWVWYSGVDVSDGKTRMRE